MKNKFKIGIVTTSRADFGIYQSVLEALSQKPNFEIGLFVTGMHLKPEFGLTIQEIEKSPYKIWAQFDGLENDDSALGVAKSMGKTTIAAAEALNQNRPDLLVVLGDRFEMHAVALAALPLCIPISHIHGGEETEGAIDNSLRHSITKLSHLHFCSTELAKTRILSMGENPNNTIISGAPALDMINRINILNREELKNKFNIPSDKDFALITYHPVTTTPEQSIKEFNELCAAIIEANIFTVFTFANADTLGRTINDKINDFVNKNPNIAMVVGHLGTQGYFSAMNAAKVMIGNSSSGILEAASFALPVVNIGDRQKGREQSPNIINSSGNKDEILNALKIASSADYLEKCQKRVNLYFHNNAGEIISNNIELKLKSGIEIQKQFYL